MLPDLPQNCYVFDLKTVVDRELSFVCLNKSEALGIVVVFLVGPQELMKLLKTLFIPVSLGASLYKL